MNKLSKINIAIENEKCEDMFAGAGRRTAI